VKRRASVRQPELFTMPAGKRARPPALPKIVQQLLERGLPVPEEEYQFAIALGRKWRFDYAWPAQRIAFEQEGAAFGRAITGQDGKTYRLGGRHNTGQGMSADALKYNRAAILGWCVIRATTTMIRDGEAIGELVDAFTARGWKP
jgi:hypothetical protein